LLFVQAPAVTNFYLIYPDIHVSTKAIFEHHEVKHDDKKFNRLFTLYINELYPSFFRKSYNVLTETTLNVYPDLKHVVRTISKISPLARMTGSGSTYYIPIFKQNEHKIARKIEKLPFLVVKTSVKH
jgi:4-diphosphocytidyl-2C-methyl-D-erythritol kinase